MRGDGRWVQELTNLPADCTRRSTDMALLNCWRICVGTRQSLRKLSPRIICEYPKMAAGDPCILGSSSFSRSSTVFSRLRIPSTHELAPQLCEGSLYRICRRMEAGSGEFTAECARKSKAAKCFEGACAPGACEARRACQSKCRDARQTDMRQISEGVKAFGGATRGRKTPTD